MPVARKANEHPVAHALATHSRMATNEWRHKIRLQEFFEDETTHELIDSLCRRAVQELDAIIRYETEATDHKSENERDYFIKYLNESRDGFDGLISAADGETVEDREESFNYVLEDLFDLGDMKIGTHSRRKSSVSQVSVLIVRMGYLMTSQINTTNQTSFRLNQRASSTCPLKTITWFNVNQCARVKASQRRLNETFVAVLKSTLAATTEPQP